MSEQTTAPLSPSEQFKTDLDNVLDAAGSWANELTEYIAPASEQFEDEESAQNQQAQADEITAAVDRLAVLTPDPVERLDGGEPTNAAKAGFALTALRAHRLVTGGDPGEDEDALTNAVVDLLADLAHFTAKNDLDFNALLETALLHYEAETGHCFKCGASVQKVGEVQLAPFCDRCGA